VGFPGSERGCLKKKAGAGGASVSVVGRRDVQNKRGEMKETKQTEDKKGGKERESSGGVTGGSQSHMKERHFKQTQPAEKFFLETGTTERTSAKTRDIFEIEERCTD